MRHFHNFGPWLVIKVGEKDHLPDKEFIQESRFPPMWKQQCDCGQENRIRSRARPKRSLKLREVWGSKVW